MRILIMGFIVFVGWSVLSTYIYVCKIKGLCIQTQTTLVEEVSPSATLVADPKVEEKITSKVEETIAIPKELVIYFAFDKSDFISSEEAKIYFDKSNAYIRQYAQAKLKITGHTDAVGTIKYNQALGLKRAIALQKYFEKLGIPASRMVIESKGEKEPAAENTSDLGRAKNRRTVVTIKQ
jgi:outer membrane protein OmpA-like peptidoglycan-associated protein